MHRRQLAFPRGLFAGQFASMCNLQFQFLLVQRSGSGRPRSLAAQALAELSDWLWHAGSREGTIGARRRLAIGALPFAFCNSRNNWPKFGFFFCTDPPSVPVGD